MNEDEKPKQTGVLEDFANVNTSVDESAAIKHRKREIEASLVDFRKKAKEIEQGIVSDIVNESERKRVILEKQSDLLNPKEDKIAAFKTLVDVQEVILLHLQKTKDEKKSNILSKKIKEQEVLNAYEFLGRFEDLKNQAVHLILDFINEFQKEKDEIDGRSEPYFVSEGMFSVVLDLLKKIEKMISKEKYLLAHKTKLQAIIKKLENPKDADRADDKDEDKKESLGEGVIDLKQMAKNKESLEKEKFEVLFEKRIDIPDGTTIESLVIECGFDRQSGLVNTKGINFLRKSSNVKVISFAPGTSAESVKESMRKNNLRFVDTREFLFVMKDYRDKISSKVQGVNKRNNKKFDLGMEADAVLDVSAVSLTGGGKIFFERNPVLKESRWSGKDKIIGFNTLFVKKDGDNKINPSFESYVVADMEGFDLFESKPDVWDYKINGEKVFHYDGDIAVWGLTSKGIVMLNEDKLLLNGKDVLCTGDIKKANSCPRGIFYQIGNKIILNGREIVCEGYFDEWRIFGNDVVVRKGDQFLLNGKELMLEYSGEYDDWEGVNGGIIFRVGNRLLLQGKDTGKGPELLYEGDIDGWLTNDNDFFVRDKNGIFLNGKELIVSSKIDLGDWDRHPIKKGVVVKKGSDFRYYGK
jgi:hypothetical protein